MTNDAERVSDIVARLRSGLPLWNPNGGSLAEAIKSANRLMTNSADIIEAQSKALAEAREALTDVRLWARNARGAIESNQVVDKDVRGSMNRIIARIDALTPTPENPNG